MSAASLIMRFAGRGAATLALGLALAPGPAVAAPADYDVVAPAPWVEVLPLPAAPAQSTAEAAQGAERYLLVDRQVRMDGAMSAYIHCAVRLLTQAGVDAESQLKVEFDPQRERLHLHAVSVHRAGKSIDQLTAGRIEILHRESGLENGLIDGQLTFHLLLSDVRVGDVAEYSYTLERHDPEWGERHYAHYTVRWDVPADHSRLRVLARQKAPLYTLNHDSVQPMRRVAGGWQELEWTWKNLEAMTTLDDAPTGFEQHPSIEVSQFADWREVAAAAAPLYAVAGNASSERSAVLARLRAAGATDAERALAAIRFVQEEVRYTGIELGQGAFRPRAPDEVLAHRYGDCKDKALLAVTLLRGLGIEADPVLVSTRWQDHLRERLASPGAMNHVIVRARIAGATYWFDVTRTAQGGDLAHAEQSHVGTGLVIAPGSAGLVDLPPAQAELTQLVVSEIYDLTAGLDSEASLAVATRHRGPRADWMRGYLRTATPEKLAQDYLNFYKGQYPSIRAAGALQVRDDVLVNEITIDERYRVERPFSTDGNGRMSFEVNGYVVGERLKAPSRPVRTIPLALDAPVNVAHQIEVRLPEPWPVKDAYRRIDGPGFRYDSHTRQKGNDVYLDYRYRTFADRVGVEQLTDFLARREEARSATFYSFSYNANPTETPAQIEQARTLLQQAGELAQKNEAAKATQSLQSLFKLPGFAGLDADQKHAAWLLAGALAFDRRDWTQALGYLQQCSVMEEGAFADWEMRLQAAQMAGNPADATQSLTEIARRWPQDLHKLDEDILGRAVGQAPHTGSARFGLLKALRDAHYEMSDGTDLSWWWLELGRRHLERGEPDAAVAALQSVKEPFALVQILADNRYEPVRARLAANLDVAAAAQRGVEEARATSERSPHALSSLLQYIEALLVTRQYEAALQRLDAVIARITGSANHAGYSDYQRRYIWVLDMRSRALQGLGRWDEAVAQLIEASHLPENRGDNVSQVINLAGLYNEIGRPREALAALAALGERNQSPYGQMQVANESLGAAVQLGDTAAIERHLGFLKEHQSDSPRTYQVGLLIADRPDESAALLVSRLINPDQRDAALADVQDYAHGAQTARDLELLRRWQSILQRTDVLAAIRKAGTIGSYPITSMVF